MLSLPLHSPPSAPRVKAERSQHEGENCHPPPSAPRVKAERSQHEGKHRHPPPSAPAAWERKGAGGKVRATLTPDPSPALRERGDLGCSLGIVERRRRRIAPAPLILPLPLPV